MPKAKAKKAKIEYRRKQVAANLLGGMTYRQMVEALGVSLGTISNDVKIIFGRWQREQVQEVDKHVTLELRRLDVAINAIWNDVVDGKLGSIDRLLRIQERAAKYRGLDAPAKLEHSGPDGKPLVLRVKGFDDV